MRYHSKCGTTYIIMVKTSTSNKHFYNSWQWHKNLSPLFRLKVYLHKMHPISRRLAESTVAAPLPPRPVWASNLPLPICGSGHCLAWLYLGELSTLDMVANVWSWQFQDRFWVKGPFGPVGSSNCHRYDISIGFHHTMAICGSFARKGPFGHTLYLSSSWHQYHIYIFS